MFIPSFKKLIELAEEWKKGTKTGRVPSDHETHISPPLPTRGWGGGWNKSKLKMKWN
jgi:hypothetical protein